MVWLAVSLARDFEVAYHDAISCFASGSIVPSGVLTAVWFEVCRSRASILFEQRPARGHRQRELVSHRLLCRRPARSSP